MKLYLAALITLILVVSAGALASPYSYEANLSVANQEEPADPSLVPVLLVNGEPVLLTEGSYTYILTNPGTDVRILSQVGGPVDASIELRGKWQLGSDLWITGSLFVFNGLFIAQSYAVKAEAVFWGQYDVEVPLLVNLGNSTWDTTIFAVRGKSVSVNAGSSRIVTTVLLDNSARSGQKYNNVVIKDSGTIYGWLEGRSEFNEVTFDSPVSYVADNVTTKIMKVTKGKVISVATGTRKVNDVTITENGIGKILPKK